MTETSAATGDTPTPLSSPLFFTPRFAGIDSDRVEEAGACAFISPEIDGASCYKYSVGEGARLVLGGDHQIELATGSAIDQVLAPGLNQGLSSDLLAETKAGTGVKNVFALGIEYQKRVRELDLGLSTTVLSSAHEADDDGQLLADVQSWKLGLSAGYTGFTFSTSFIEDRVSATGEQNRFSNRDGQETYDLAIKYDMGPWAFGLQYSHSELDTVKFGAPLGDQKIDSYEIGGSYLMGPHLSLGAAIQFWKWDEFAGSTTDDERKQDLLFLIGSRLKF